MQVKNLYDRSHDFRDTPPYHHHAYKSIYEGIIIEIQIVDHCNLNCAFCNHFSPIADLWYISVEDFTSQIQVLSENIPNVKQLILIGGEPTLHPQLLQLCQIAHNILPDTIIEIFTNGIKLSYLESMIDQLCNLNTFVTFCSYPGYQNIDKIDTFINKYNNNAGYANTRVFMQQTLVDELGSEDANYNYFNCNHHNLPCFTIKNNKLYICPFAAHVEHYFKKLNLNSPEVEEDYLNLQSIKNNLDIIQDFIFTAKPICAYCKHESNIAIWQKSQKDLIEYNTSLQDLYYNDYDRYEKIINAGQDYFFNCLNNKSKTAVWRSSDCGDWVKKTLNRYGQGKIDIIIPHYNVPYNFIQRLYKSLCDQTIIQDCVIYLISDNSPNEKQVIDLFNSNPMLNCVFLKNLERSGPGVARNKGLENSFNDYILMIDADDYFIDNNGLEILYNCLAGTDFLLQPFHMYQDNYNELHNYKLKGNMLFHRSLLTNYNLRFKPIFICEDYIFMQNLHHFIEDGKKLDVNDKVNNVSQYGLKNNKTNLTSECAATTYKMTFAVLSSRFLLFQDLMIGNQKGKDDLYKEIISNIYDVYNESRFNIMRLIAYVLLYEIYQHIPQYFINNENMDICLIKAFETNSHSYTTFNAILTNYDDIKNEAKNILKYEFENSILFKRASELVLSYL